MVFEWLKEWVWSPVVFIGLLLCLSTVKKVLFSKFTLWASKTDMQWDDILVSAANAPCNFLIIVLSLWSAQFFIYVPPQVSLYIPEAMRLLITFAVLFFMDRFLVKALGVYAQKNPTLSSSQKLITNITHVVIGIILSLVVLSFIGISITPILASLGIGTMAVALALQDTLVNVFSGMHLLIDKPILKGQFISLDDGRQGFVQAIGWRSTRLRLLSNDIVVIPNSKLSSSIITNYDLNHPQTYFSVKCRISYDSDLEKVEKVALEEAKKVLKEHPQAVSEFQPSFSFREFLDSGIEFSVSLAAKHYIEHWDIKSQFIKNLHRRFKAENIVIPYPSRTIYKVLDAH